MDCGLVGSGRCIFPGAYFHNDPGILSCPQMQLLRFHHPVRDIYVRKRIRSSHAQAGGYRLQNIDCPLECTVIEFSADAQICIFFRTDLQPQAGLVVPPHEKRAERIILFPVQLSRIGKGNAHRQILCLQRKDVHA